MNNLEDVLHVAVKPGAHKPNPLSPLWQEVACGNNSVLDGVAKRPHLFVPTGTNIRLHHAISELRSMKNI